MRTADDIYSSMTKIAHKAFEDLWAEKEETGNNATVGDYYVWTMQATLLAVAKELEKLQSEYKYPSEASLETIPGESND